MLTVYIKMKLGFFLELSPICTKKFWGSRWGLLTAKFTSKKKLGRLFRSFFVKKVNPILFLSS